MDSTPYNIIITLLPKRKSKISMKKQILLIALVNIFPLTSLFAFTNILWRTDLAGKVNSCTRINEKLCIVCNQNFYYVDMLNGNIDHNLSVNSCIPSKYGIITYDYHSIQILDHKVSFNVKWTFTGSIGQSIKKPYISNCKLFFQIFEGNIADLYFIDMENNNTSASKNFSSYIPGSNYVLIDNNYLLAERGSNSCRNSSLIDLNENFKAIWSFSNSYPVIEINQDVIVRLTENYGEKNYFASLRSLTGTKLWEFEANSYIASENSKIYFGYNNETTSTYTLYCLNAKNGTTLWQYQTPGFINTTPILHKNNLYMGSNENKIYCFNAKTGQTKWTFNITGFPVAASDDCLFIDDNGKLSCMVINPVTVQHPFDTYAITSDNQISITVSDHTIASISENTITALKNGRITVTFQLMNLTHEMPVFCYHHTDTRELEPNNTKNTATFLNENTFLKADLFENDVDYYQISLSHSTVLDLAFLPFSNMTVVHMKVFDPFGNQMAWDESSHGNPLIMPLSLSKGMYYIHIQYSDASYIDHDTPSYILAYQCYQKPYDLRQMEYEPNNAPHVSDFLQNNTVKKGRIQSVSDIDFYGFHLNARSLYTIYFNPDGGDYKIVLYDDSDNVLNQRYAEGDETIAFESFNNQGNYYVKVEPVGKILPFSMYDIHIQSNEDIAQVSKLTHLSIQYQSLSLAVGESTLLTAFAHYANGTSEIIHTPEFKSLDETVVGMDSNYMTGKSKGVTSIVLVYKGLTSHIEITVEGESLKHHGNLILVAGGGNDTNDPLFDSTQYLSDRVYKVFLTRVFNDQSIYYINPVTGVHDIDGDGLPDQIVDNNTPSVSSLESTITQWAVDQFTDGPLYVVLIDHGSIDTFKLAQNEILNAGSFNDYLDLFQEKTNRNVIVFIEPVNRAALLMILKMTTA